ncbi:hypothetical protein [Maricaulis sp.]|uniref:hypothetical protein n=1 Tax=Maricaulis sp. TaxID=1486257 RepID=UPI003A919E19
MHKTVCLSAALLALSAAPAFADEAWSSNLGPVIYDDEIGDYAILLHYDGAVPHHTFIRGLAGNFSTRDQFTGYWSEQEDIGSTSPACDIAIIDEFGQVTHHWGRVEINFLRPGFPTEWDARIGSCFEEPAQSWNGRLDDNFDYDSFGPQEGPTPKER